MNDSQYWDGFWVFAGSERSTRFPRAVPVDRAFADRVLRTATGQPYAWSTNRSELQVIGSYTRACRRIIDPDGPDVRRQDRRPQTFRRTRQPRCSGKPVMNYVTWCWIGLNGRSLSVNRQNKVRFSWTVELEAVGVE